MVKFSDLEVVGSGMVDFEWKMMKVADDFDSFDYFVNFVISVGYYIDYFVGDFVDDSVDSSVSDVSVNCADCLVM